MNSNLSKSSYQTINVNKIASLCILALIATSGIKWIPLFRIGGIEIEIHNAVSLVSFGIFTFLLFYKKKITISNEYIFLFMAIFLICTISIIRGDQVSNNIKVSLPAIFGSILVLQIRNTNFIKKYYYLCFLFLFAALFVSAKVSGQDFVTGLLKYYTSLNRDAFLYQTLRPIFNAFSPSKEEILYGGPLVNHLSSGFYILFAIASAKLCCSRRILADWIVALLSFLIIFSLFSSTVLGTSIITLLVFGVLFLKNNKSKKVLLSTISILLLVIPLLIGFVFRYLTEGLVGDTGSLTSRLSQNHHALDSIASNIFFGSGPISFGGHGLHNLPLFAWTEGGILAFTCILIFYYFCLKNMFIALTYLLSKNDSARYEAFLMFVLPVFIIIRTFFGGGGGMPATSESIALALLVIAKRDFNNEKNLAKFD